MTMPEQESAHRMAIHRLAVEFACGEEDWTPAQRHKLLNDLVSAIREYQQNHPVPMADRGFGWRVPPDLPEEDIQVLIYSYGCIWTGHYEGDGDWFWNSSSGGRRPDAWSYIPELT